MNNFDVDAFVLALTDAAAYELAFTHCDINNADTNGDASVNNCDVDSFAAAEGMIRAMSQEKLFGRPMCRSRS